MADIVSSEKRSAMMAGIRRSRTKPEMLVRRALHAAGFRFRTDCRNLPGAPDLFLTRYNAAIFVHGCFWHGHDCHLFRMPATRSAFWADKIGRNQQRDRDVMQALKADGYRTMVIWECALRGQKSAQVEKVMKRVGRWLLADTRTGTLRGRRRTPEE